MLHKVGMLAAGGVGYVLGAKAGRERFEQIRHAVEEAPLARDKVMAAAEKIRHGEMPGMHLGHNGRTPQTGPAGRASQMAADPMADPMADPRRAPQTGPVVSPDDDGFSGDDAEKGGGPA